MALWTLSGTTWVSQYQKVHFAIFWIFWCKKKITQADAPTIQMDCHPIHTNWCPHLYHPTIFTPNALPGTTLPIYPGLEQAPNMLACITGDTRYLQLFALPSVLWCCWLGGRKGIRPVKNWVVGCWHGCLAGMRCRLAYSPADATATHYLLLQ